MREEQPRLVMTVVAILVAPLIVAYFLSDGQPEPLTPTFVKLDDNGSLRYGNITIDRLVDGSWMVFDGTGNVYSASSQEEGRRAAKYLVSKNPNLAFRKKVYLDDHNP